MYPSTLFDFRDGWPVHPIKQSSQTPSPASVASSPRPQTPHDATPSHPPGPPMESSPPAAEDKPVRSAQDGSGRGDGSKVKPSVMNELDFDLGDVSEDESWEVRQ